MVDAADGWMDGWMKERTPKNAYSISSPGEPTAQVS